MINWNRAWKYILLVIGLVLMMFLVMDFNSRMAELRRLSTQADQAAARVTQLHRTETYLHTQIAYATSDEIVEEYAYEEMKMVRDGDHPIVPISPTKSTPVPEEEPEPQTRRVDNWQIWLALFFDQPAP
jgi:cell division protein FtsB